MEVLVILFDLLRKGVLHLSTEEGVVVAYLLVKGKAARKGKKY